MREICLSGSTSGRWKRGKGSYSGTGNRKGRSHARLLLNYRATSRLYSDPSPFPTQVVGQTMQHWLGDTDFNGVRGAEALAKLLEAERGDWQRLWEEVAALRRQAQPKEK
jgi:hypothetical protein